MRKDAVLAGDGVFTWTKRKYGNEKEYLLRAGVKILFSFNL